MDTKAKDKEMERDIEKTLRDILEYVGADLKYAEYAALRTMLKWLIDRNR